MNPLDKLSELGIELPEPTAPIASYVPAVLTGNYVFVSGQIPIRDGKLVCEGRIPDDVSIEEGYEAAKLVAINILAVVKGVTGDLSRIKRIVRLNGFVQSDSGFTMQPQVINGASDLFVEIFGEIGKHSRAAVGVSSLPLNSPVEIDAVIEIRD